MASEVKIIPSPILYKVLNRGRLEGVVFTLFVTILLFLLFGCASHHKKLEIDQKLKPFVSKFEKIGNIKIDNLIVKFNTLGDGVLAQCSPKNTPLIELNSRYIKETFIDAEVEMIMFHELGHCILMRPHSKSVKSLMYPSIFPVEVYIEFYPLYISELFGIEYTKTYEESNE